MKSYFYIVSETHTQGRPQLVTVYQIVKNQPVFVGNSWGEKTAWRGARDEAQKIIHDAHGIPFEKKTSRGRPQLVGLCPMAENCHSSSLIFLNEISLYPL